MGRYPRLRAARIRTSRRFVVVITVLVLVATSVQSSNPVRPESAPNTANAQASPASPTSEPANTTSSVVTAQGVDVTGGSDGSGGSGGSTTNSQTVALSTTGGALGGYASGNATLRVEPAAATFPKVPTEVVSLRDAHRRVVANPNGTLTATASTARLNFQDSSGSWQAIDASLTSSGSTKGYNLAEASNNGTIAFNTTTVSDPIAILAGSSFSLTFRVPGLSGEGKQAGPSGLQYVGTGSGSSIVLNSNSDGFEFGATLHAKDAPSSYSFAVGTNGLSLAVAPDGRSVEVLTGQGSDKKVLGIVSAPSLMDARGGIAPAEAVGVGLDPAAPGLRDGETMLTYTIDRNWLAASGRAYPVTLDPTVCINWDANANCSLNVQGRGNGYVDTYINETSPDQVGTGTFDFVGTDASGGKIRSLYYFPHLNLPDGAQIVNAQMSVFLADGTAPGHSVVASGIASTWSGFTATWNNQPTIDASTSASTAVGAAGAMNIDVTGIERARYTRNGVDWKPDYGLELRIDEATCTAGTCGPLAFNAGSMRTNEPTLSITYTAPHVRINFDPALGPDYAPTKMPAGSATNVPVQINNNGSGYTFNRCGGSTADCYEVGYRWYDSKGYSLTGPGSSGMVDLPVDIGNQGWSSPFNLPVMPPPGAGQYGLRIDLVHVVNNTFLWASDWAYPSLYMARAKSDLNSTNVHLTGQSVVERNDYTVAVFAGAMAGGDPKSVTLPDGSSASIDLASGNLTLQGSSGIGFADLSGSLNLTYYYDSAQTTQTTACDLILGACGWGTNFDERIENATSGANLVYRDPAGNRYFVSPNANGQLVSNAPVKIDRPRVTVLDENVIGPWTTTGTGLPSVTTDTAANGTHGYGFSSANSAGATTSAVNVDINQYPLAGFSVKSAAGGAGVGFNIKDNTTGATKWLIYTFGTDFAVSGSAVKVPLGGNTSSWLTAGGDTAPGSSAFPNELNVWSRVVADGTFGGPNDDFSVVGLGLYGNGTAGTDYIDALRFEPRPTGIFDDPSTSMPAWTSGGSNAVASTVDKQIGTSAIRVLPADAASEPKCLCLNASVASLSSAPYATWYWRKVGGSSVAETFFVHDANDPGQTGSITYYAGPSVPAGVDPSHAVQVSPTAPNSWTRVTRDLEDDARQLLSFYNHGPDGSFSVAGAAPTPDPVILDGYALLAVDGSYAGFDWESLTTQPSLDVTTGAVSGDDFVITLQGGNTHRFNADGLLTSIRDLDGNLTSLDWSYDFSSAGGPKAYKLTAVHAPSEGMTTAAGPAVRRIDVTYGTGSVKFAEKLGTASSSSGRSAEFDRDASGNLVTVVPARHVGACAPAGSASGCIAYAYDANHYLTTVFDPRYDGTNSDHTAIGYVAGSGSTPTKAVSITPASTGKPLLRVLSSGTSVGLYVRPEWQDAAAVVANYAYYADLTEGGSIYTEFKPLPCAAANCAGGTTTPAVPVDMLVAYRNDGLGNPTQETRYRLAGNQAPVISRRGTLAAAKIDNYPDPLAANQVTWTQSADQYVASVTLGNGDLYKTSVTYNDLGLQTSTTTPVSNQAYGPSAPWSKQSVPHTVELIYDQKGHLIETDDNTFLANTGFENGSGGWTLSGATIDAGVFRSGIASLSLTGSSTATQRAQLVPGQTLRLQAALKSDGGTLIVGLRYERLSDGAWLPLALQMPTVTSSWTTMANDVTIPLDGTGQIELSFSVAGGSGAAHVDDVALMSSFAASTYNALGQQMTTTDISGRVTKMGYAPDTSALPAGMPTPGATPAIFPATTVANYIDGVFDPAHPDQDVASRATYDVWGRAVRKTDADGVASWQLYAPNGTDVLASTDALGNATTMTYDEVGNKLSVTPPNGASERTVTTYSYLNGPLVTTTPDGTKTRIVYDDAGRVSTKYANYATGNPTAGTLTDIATTYAYDEYGHVKTTTGDQGVANAVTETSYDLLGNTVTTTTHAVAGDAGRTTTNIFDAAGRAAGVQNAIAPTAAPAPPCPPSWMDVWEQMPAFGTPVSLNITIPGQNGSVTFSGIAGQRVSVLVQGNSGPTVTVKNPDGTTLASGTIAYWWNNYFTLALTLPQTGTYQIGVNLGGATGAYNVTAWNVPPDAVSATSANGSEVFLNVTTPGQNGSVTFSGTTGQRVSIMVKAPAFTQNEDTPVTVTGPDGSVVASGVIAYWWGNFFTDVLTLQQTGTYTISISPGTAYRQAGALVYWDTGTFSFTVWTVPQDVALSSAANGSPSTVNITTPGQNGAVTFSGTAGQRVNVQISAGSSDTPVSITNPDGTTLTSGTIAYWWNSWGSGLITLPQTGTYSVNVSPGGPWDPANTALNRTDTGQYNVTIWIVPGDLAIATSIDASPVTANVVVPGQNATVTFSGTAGQRVNVLLTAGFSGTPVSITNPDGTTLASGSIAYWWNSWGSGVVTLGQTGTYTISITAGGSTGQYTVHVWSVPPDISLSTSANGLPLTVNVPVSGQNATVTFSGTAGQSLNVVISAGFSDTPVSITNPDGTTLASGSIAYWYNNWGSGVLTLSQAGTYTISIAAGGSTGQYTVTVTDTTTVFALPAAPSRRLAAESIPVSGSDTVSSVVSTVSVTKPSLTDATPRAAGAHVATAKLAVSLTDALPPTTAAAPAASDGAACFCNSIARFDLNGQAVASVDTRGITSVAWFDLSGHKVRTVANYIDGVFDAAHPDQDVVSSTQYDTLGRTVSSSDALSRVTTNTYDGLDRVTKVTRPDLSWTRTDYTAAGRTLQASTPGASNQGDSDVAWTRNVYDAAGRQTQTLRNFDRSGSAQYQYDGFETGTTTCSGSADGGFVLASSTADTTADSVAAASGLARLRVTASGAASSGVSCSLAGSFNPGQTYHLRVHLFAANGTALTAVLGKDVAASTNKQTASVTATGSWQWTDLDWTPSAGSGTAASVAVVTSAASGTIFYLDDVSVWNTATPATNIPTTSVYNADGKIVRSLGAPGHAGDPQPLTATTYDAMGRMLTVTTAATSAKALDAADANLTTSYVYNALGQKTDTTDPKGIIAHLDYSRTGNVIASTANYLAGGESNNFQNLRSAFAYDSLGELLGTCSPAATAAACDPASGTDTLAWHYLYDAMGHMTSQTPPRANPADSNLGAVAATGFVYDVSGLLVSTCSSVTGDCGSALRHTDASYDGLGRQTQTRLYSGSDTSSLKMTSTSGYDAAGQIVSTALDGTGAGEAAGAVGYTYDLLGNKKTVSGGSGSSSATYNPDGTVATRTDASGLNTFTYNKMGQLLTSTGAAYNGTLTYGWRLDGLMASRGWPNSLAAVFTYDGANRPIGETVGSLAAFVRSYDRDGNVLSDAQSMPGIAGLAGASTQTYAYDNVGRVLTDTTTDSANQQLGQKTYAYDADSNRVSVTDSGVSTGYEYNALDQIVSSTAAGVRTTFAYDAFGNMTKTFVNPNGPLPPPTAPPVTTYYAESSSIMTRSGSSQWWGYTGIAGTRDGNTDIYEGGSVSFSLSGPGSLTLHQFAGGTATLSIDGQTAGSLSGGCAADNAQTFTVSGAGSHVFLVSNIAGHPCDSGWGWGFDGADWTVAGAYTSADSGPTNVTATPVGYNQVNLTWSAPVNNPNLLRYAISRNGTPLTTVAAGTTSMTDWTAVPGTAYTYSVTAADAAGNTSAAAAAPAVTTAAYIPPADTTVPSTPAGLTATAKNASEIDLAWTASTDNVAVAGYKVYRNSALIATTASTTYADTPIAAGSANTYYVVAIDGSANASASSTSASATTAAADTTAPTVPTAVTATSTVWNSATVNWTASTDAVGVTSYNVLRNGTAIGKVSGSATGFVDATTQPGTAYTYTVTATDAAVNTSAASSGAAVTTAACASCTTTLSPVADSYVNQASTGTNYGTATTFVIKGTSGSAENGYLRFDTTSVPAGAITGATLKLYSTGASSTGYTVKAESNTTWGESTITYANAPALGSTITSVASTTANAYSSATVTSAVTTRGLISFGITDPSTTTPVTFNSKENATTTTRPQLVVTTLPTDTTAPSLPTALTGTVKSGSEVDLTWVASTDNTAVAGYRVYRDGTLIATVGSTSWFDTGLAAGSAHTYAVSAIDAAGNASAQTATISKTTLGTTADTTAPTVPTAVTATSTVWNSATVSWTASTDAVGVTSYNVLRNGTALGKVSGSATSFVDATTQPGTAYTYSVTAADAAGNTSAAAAAPAVTTAACATCTTTTTINPVADSFVNQASTATNYGSLTTLTINGAATAAENGYLRFDTTSVPAGTITAATLNLYSTGASSSGYTVASESNTTWGETTITYANAPALGATITSVGSTVANAYSSATVTSAVTTRGLISFGITDPSTTTTVTFNTKENATTTTRPQLVVTTYALPTDTTIPSVPTTLAGTVKSNTEVDLTWAASTDNTAVSGYRVYRDGTLIATVGSTSWFDTGLAAGSAHTYAVSAIDAAGNASAQTATISKTTLNVAPIDVSLPTAPTGVAAASSVYNKATVTWTASTDNIAVTSYTISRNGSVIAKVNGSATSFVDGTTVASTTYTYSVTATDAAGNASAAVAAPVVTTPAPTPPADTTAPSAPAALAGTVKSGSEVDLTWSASTDNVAVAGYKVYRDGSAVATVGSTTWFDLGLATGSAHTYQISALDGSGNESAKSASISKTTLNVVPPDTSAPTVPTNVAATSTAPNSATVTWTASTDNTAVTSYTITRGTIVTKVSGMATSYTDVTTASATAYTYTVTALDAAGNASVASAPATVTTPVGPLDTVKPTVPTGLTATSAPTEIDLAWTAATDDAAVAGYKILRDGTLIGTTYSTTYSDTGLAAGIAHTYTVAAFDGAGNSSDPSTVATATASPAPPASVSYAYDIADRLTSITTASGTATVFSIDPLGRHASQTIGTAPTATYSYLGTTDIVVSIAAGSGTTTSALDALGERVAVSAGGTGGFLLPDLHGNTAGALNAAASSITDAFAYDAYGNTVAAVTSGLPTPWRYQGRMLESAAGSADLYDFGSRSYSPSIGTFTSLDSEHGSAGNPALLNGYLYANANPATLVDPDGHCPECVVETVEEGAGLIVKAPEWLFPAVAGIWSFILAAGSATLTSTYPAVPASLAAQPGPRPPLPWKVKAKPTVPQRVTPLDLTPVDPVGPDPGDNGEPAPPGGPPWQPIQGPLKSVIKWVYRLAPIPIIGCLLFGEDCGNPQKPTASPSPTPKPTFTPGPTPSPPVSPKPPFSLPSPRPMTSRASGVVSTPANVPWGYRRMIL